MADSHGSAGWPGQGPMPLRELARHMQSCAPCAQSLLETARDGRPGRRVARRDRPDALLVDTVMARALDDGDVKAALVIYDMARESLALVPEYSEQVVTPNRSASFGDLVSQACLIASRLPDGNHRIATLPRLAPTAASAAGTANLCLDVVERFTRNWPWVEFERAMVAVARGESQVAKTACEDLRRRAGCSDSRLNYFLLRNLGMIAERTADRSALQAVGEAMQMEWPNDAASLWFCMESGLRSGDVKIARQLEDRFVLAATEQGAAEWRQIVAHALTAVPGTGHQLETVERFLNERSSSGS